MDVPHDCAMLLAHALSVCEKKRKLDDGIGLMPGPVLAREVHLASPLLEPHLRVPAVVVELPAHRQAGRGG